MSDPGHNITEQIIKELEAFIARNYKKANREIGKKADDYFRRFEVKDKIKRDQLKRGVITKAEYIQWRKGQLLIGSRWEEMRNTLAEDFHHANGVARQAVLGTMPDVYALNHWYGTYDIEHNGLVDTSYTLYSRDAAEKAIQGEYFLPRARKHSETFTDYLTSIEYDMPELGKKAAARIAAGQDVLWNAQQINSVILQGILQGMPIPALATKLEEVTEKNHKAAIRNARTAMTSAQNAGRQAAYERAEKLGINCRKQWIATLDGRTRHEHRILDGQTVPVDEMFQVDGLEIEYPGDPHAAARLVYNCRCTMRTQIKGFEVDATDLSLRNTRKLGNMSYDEWVNAKATSDPIEKQEWIANIMKGKYIRDYRR